MLPQVARARYGGLVMDAALTPVSEVALVPQVALVPHDWGARILFWQ